MRILFSCGVVLCISYITSIFANETLFSLSVYPPEYDSLTARKVVNNLDFDKFKSNIETLADFGHRAVGSLGNKEARDWLEETLENLGYDDVTLQSSYDNVYATKEGSVSPDSVYIISAHYDGVSKAQSANDDASGCALVLEGARVFASPLIKTRYSIRFVLWNSEETGLHGSKAYVGERRPLQGNGEPVWLAMIAHDMLLYDHGLPPQSEQIPGADIDIEYKAGSPAADKSKAFAEELQKACKDYSPEYPAEIGSNMSNTDSDPFKNYIASVSIRDLQRLSEIGNGGDPTWHTALDRYEYFSEKDFLLGFNTVQMTVGAMCRLAGVYDSIPTQIKDAKQNYSTHTFHVPATGGIRVFDTQGRKIVEDQISSKWLEYKRMLPQGLYIVQFTNNKVHGECRVLKVGD